MHNLLLDCTGRVQPSVDRGRKPFCHGRLPPRCSITTTSGGGDTLFAVGCQHPDAPPAASADLKGGGRSASTELPRPWRNRRLAPCTVEAGTRRGALPPIPLAPGSLQSRDQTGHVERVYLWPLARVHPHRHYIGTDHASDQQPVGEQARSGVGELHRHGRPVVESQIDPTVGEGSPLGCGAGREGRDGFRWRAEHDEPQLLVVAKLRDVLALGAVELVADRIDAPRGPPGSCLCGRNGQNTDDDDRQRRYSPEHTVIRIVQRARRVHSPELVWNSLDRPNGSTSVFQSRRFHSLHRSGTLRESQSTAHRVRDTDRRWPDEAEQRER